MNSSSSQHKSRAALILAQAGLVEGAAKVNWPNDPCLRLMAVIGSLKFSAGDDESGQGVVILSSSLKSGEGIQIVSLTVKLDSEIHSLTLESGQGIVIVSLTLELDTALK
ncbi:hypothetical protein RRG08_050922 [Elysia crispata]|uniref:Uncharacterized protein n=1 Tax=Elysia crispata TaxID=231223 RepID=A0AAE1D3B4_9GAST|nr:hypothetical protein RRG08_050922 [Elysia crispata]